jgi:hypothetical protein
MFAGLGAQALCESLDGLAYEFEGWQWCLTRVAGKDVVLDFWAEAGGLHALLHAHLEALGVGLVAPEDGVDGFEEGGHAVIAFGAGTVEPGDVAIGAGDIAVGAGGDGDDDFSGVVHGAAPQGVLGNHNARGTGCHVFGCLGEGSKEKRDFSLRRLKLSQERKRKKKSACSVRNDGWC